MTAGSANRRIFVRGWRTAATVGPAIVVLLLGALLFAADRGFTRNFEEFDRSVATETALYQTFSTLRDAELGQRGFLITGDTAYLALFERSQAAVHADLDSIARADEDPGHQEQLAEIHRLALWRITRLDSALAVQRSAGTVAAFAFVRRPAGRAIMDSLRLHIRAFQSHRQEDVRDWKAVEQRYRRWFDIALFVGIPLAVLLALAATAMLSRAEQDVRAGSLRTRVLADAGAALATALDPDLALQAAPGAAVPALADLCIVDLLEVDGRPRRAGIAHADPDVVNLVRDAAAHGPRTGNLPPDAALRTESSIFMQRVTPGVLEAAAANDVQRAAIRAVDAGSLMSVPMRAQGLTIGVLTLIRGRGREPFTEEDLATAEELARRTTAAVDTSRVFRIAVAARAEAEQANRAKSTFLATMSHELRTPLNAVLGYVDLLDAELAGPLTPGQRDYIARVRTSGRHLLGLIAEILDLAKVESGQMTVRSERVRIAPGLGSAVELVRPLADTRRITIDENCDRSVEYCGDEDRVRQILVNLLSNAVKFTEPGGAVTVECLGASHHPDPSARISGEGPWVGITVRDTGIGIPSEKLEAIFAPFVQVESGHTREVGGTGLGLSISRSLARLMDGDLTVESQVGAGSAFTLWLPAYRMPASEAMTYSGDFRSPSSERRLEVGRALQSRAAEIVRHLSDRLRKDPEVPLAKGTIQADLEDHIAGYVTDLAQSLTIVDAPAGVDRASLQRDGDALQYTYSVRHGAQRRRLGWSEASVRREYELLADEIERAVKRSFGKEITDMAEDIVPLVRQLNEAAAERAVEGWRG